MTNGAGGGHYDVSPEGTLVYVSGESATALRRRLVWAEPGGKRTSISERLRNYYWPAIAPGGKRLAVTVLEQDNWDLWIQDLERDSQTRLTFHEGADFFAVWSPDGRWIAFCSQRDGRSQIYRQRADGSGQAERLLERKNDTRPRILLSRWEVSTVWRASSRQPVGTSGCLRWRERERSRCWRTAGSMSTSAVFSPMGAGSPTSQMNREDMRSMFGRFRATAADGRFPRRAASRLAGLGTAAGCSTGATRL